MSRSVSTDRWPRGYVALTVTTVGLTIALIAMGSIVRTTGSGLGCPDWPLCHGNLLPLRERATIIEWSHRSLAALVGLLIFVEVAWTVLRRPRWSVGVTAAAVLILLVIQAGLGRETVRRELPPEIVAIHLVTALTLLGLLVWIAIAGVAASSSDRWSTPQAPRLTIASAGMVAIVMVLGAYMVASSASLACSGWPACPEGPVPFVDGDRALTVHWLHRLAVVVGFVVISALTWTSVRSSGASIVRNTAIALFVLYSIQVLVGATNIWFQLPAAMRVIHVLLGSLLWALATAMVLAMVVHPEQPARVSTPLPAQA